MKKGFTLIELLAVIVILAIIALIAVPTITGIVEKAKKGGASESANGYIDAVNKQIAINQMDSDETNDINEGIYDAPFDQKYNLKVKGQIPTKGWAEVTKNGVDRYSLVIGDYVVSYDGNKKNIKKGNELNARPDQFKIDDWSTIIKNVRNNNTSMYNLGDTKEVDMGEFGKHTVRIANKSNYNMCNGEKYSQTACGFVLEFVDIISVHIMNNSNTNIGGWPSTEMRKYVNNDIYNSMPDDLKNAIIDTRVVSSYGKGDSDNFISLDKLYLLSPVEVYNLNHYDTSYAKTRQLDYYHDEDVSQKNYLKATKTYDDNNYNWWLRSASSYNNFSFHYAQNDGYEMNGEYPNKKYGVSPAFRIG